MGAELRVPAVHTQVSLQDARVLLTRAWERALGTTPPPQAVALLVAQWALETGRGAKMMNWNFAGIKAGESRLHTYYATTERTTPELAAKWCARDPRVTPIAGRPGVVRVAPDAPASRFAAYLDGDDGADAYLKLLHQRYKAAWAELSTGDATAYAKALKSKGYFTADVDEYARALASLAREALKSA